MTFKEQLLAAAAHEIESLISSDLRHLSPRAEPFDYLQQWLKIGRCFAYATKDDTWGEFEKLFPVIIKRLILAERELKKTKEALEKFDFRPDC